MIVEAGIAEELEALADRVLVRPEPFGHGLVDDHHERRPLVSARVKSRPRAGCQSVEIAAADRVHLDEDAIAGRRVDSLREDAAEQPARKRRVLRDGGTCDSRQRRNPLGRLLVEDLPAVRRSPHARG